MVSILVPADEKGLFDEIREQCPQNISDVNEIFHYDGNALLQAFVEISRVTIPVIASILVARYSKKPDTKPIDSEDLESRRYKSSTPKIVFRDTNGHETSLQIGSDPYTIIIATELLETFIENNNNDNENPRN